MSPTRFRYKKLGLEPVEPLKDRSTSTKPNNSWGSEKKDDGLGDALKNFQEEALA
jgi:hypothetical protein